MKNYLTPNTRVLYVAAQTNCLQSTSSDKGGNPWDARAPYRNWRFTI